MRVLEENVTGREESWSKTQLYNNVQALVFKDEQYTGFGLRNMEARSDGGPNERVYRTVWYLITHSEGGKPIGVFKGLAVATAVIPDGMPRLLEGDIIEVRRTSMYGYLKDFGATGEGSAVLRMLCPGTAVVNDAIKRAFRDCSSQMRWHEEWGEEKRYFDGIFAAGSGRPYAPHLRDHRELHFSPYYDKDGNVLPAAVPMALRPDILTWKVPFAPAVAGSDQKVLAR